MTIDTFSQKIMQISQVHISESTFIYTLNLYIYVLSIYLAMFSFCQSLLHLAIYDLSYLFYPFPNSYLHLKLITHEVMMSSTSFTVSFQPGPKYNLSLQPAPRVNFLNIQI